MSAGQFAIVPAYLVAASAADLKVYLVLALHVDYDTGVCWPSRQTIATEAGVSLSTVKRSLARLAQIGAIEIEHRRDAAGDSTSNLYRLPYAINRRGGGVTHDPTQGRQRTQGGVTREPQSRLNDQEGPRPESDRKNDPAKCAHRPVDDTGYCTACGTWLTIEIGAP